jgi:hypothetical protein
VNAPPAVDVVAAPPESVGAAGRVGGGRIEMEKVGGGKGLMGPPGLMPFPGGFGLPYDGGEP